MIYIDIIMEDVKSREEVEKIHRELIDTADDPEAFKDVERIEDFIKGYYIELDNEEDERIIRLNLRVIEERKNKIQYLHEDDQKEAHELKKEIEECKKEIQECHNEIQEIIKKYPEDYFDYIY